MDPYKIYCGGKFISASHELKIINPFGGNCFAYTFRAGEPELNDALNAGLAVEKELCSLSSFQRASILYEISSAIKSDRERLAVVLCRESAKPIRYALGEIDRAVQTFLVASEETKRLPKEYLSLDWTPPGVGKEGIVKYFPVGLVAGISPFNFPLNLAAHKIAPAIAAGCPIILKPSSLTPLSTLELAKIMDKTPLPKGAVSVLPMDRQTGNLLVTDERVKLLSFTGSPEVGWEMKRSAGKKKVVLELGGNAGVIISSCADLEKAAAKALVGGFAYSGQICIHAQRFFAEESVFQKFTDILVAGVAQLKFGNPEDPDTDVSVMIDEENARRVEQWVQEAVAGGAKILCGGKREGKFFQPTVLTGTHRDMNVCAREIFGPVVTVEPYRGFENAVAMINDSLYGLQAGIFTNDLKETFYAFHHIEAGGIIINDVPTLRFDHMPYGGIKDSGLGREGVAYAIRDMMEPRILVV